MPTLAHKAYLDSLPKEWDQVRLGVLGDVYAGSTPRRSEPKYWGGHIPWLTPSEVTGRADKWVGETDEYITDEGFGSTSVHLVPEGSLLVTTRATIGEVVIADVPITTNQGFKNLVLGSDDVPLFYYYVLRFVADEMERLASGSTFDEISKSDFVDIVVPRPSPAEQRRIADVLDTVDAAIQETDRVVEKQEQVKTGLLQDLLTRGLDANGRLRDPEREAFQKTEMGRIPLDWSVRPLDELAEIGSGVAINRSRTKTNPVELPYLRVANVQDGFLDLSEIKTVEIASSKVNRYLLKPGDVLMTEGGDYDKLGRGTVWKGQIQPCAHQNHIFRVRANQDELCPHYLSAVTGSDYGKQYFLRNSKQTTNLATINKTQLRNFPVPCPPVEEQNRILERLYTQEEQIVEERDYRKKLQRLKKGLMQELLTGRVRVPEAEVRVEEVVA